MMTASCRPLAAAYAPLLVLTACSTADRSPGVAESDSAGVHLVESAAPTWTEATRWRLSGAPVIEIGAADGDEGEQLSGVQDIDRLSDGRLVVTNSMTNELGVYSAEGEFLGTIGREGEGPGEFMYPDRVWVGTNDSLYVRAFLRLVVFDSAGTFARSVALPHSSPDDRFADGTFLHIVIPDGADTFEPGYLNPVNALLRAAADGTGADTIARVPGTEMFRLSSGGGIASFRAPFGAVRVAAADGNSVVTAGGTDFEIRSYDPTGALVRIARRATEPIPVTDADIAALEARMLQRAPSRSRPARQRLFQEWTYPDFRAALDELHVDAERNVWVRAFQVSPAEPSRWSVFDPTGQWLGQVETPAGLAVMDIGRDYVAGVWKDALDVEHVRVYALEKP